MADEMNGAQPQNVDLSRQKIDKKLKDHHYFRKFITILIIIILIALIATWFEMNADKNSYDIKVGTNLRGLQLSFDPDFKNGYEVVKAVGTGNMPDDKGGTLSDIMPDITGVMNDEKKMDIQNNGQKGGLPTNSDEFSIAKFYLRNTYAMQEDVTYKVILNTYNLKRNAFSAARIMVCRQLPDGTWEKNIYAQPSDNGGNEPVACMKRGSEELYKDDSGNDWYCKNMTYDEKSGEWFYDSEQVDNLTFTLKPMEIATYVIAIWYEGSDVNHSDKIIGGSYSMQVTFEML